MTGAEAFTSPMARKKSVEAKYSPNTYRVISSEAEHIQRPLRVSSFTSTVDMNVIGQASEPNLPPRRDHRNNRPNETHVGFLTKDVKLLNGPICDVHTNITKAEQAAWWPHRDSIEKHKIPDHPLDTTFRHDFQFRGDDTQKNTRHAANPHKHPARGSVPVNFLREKDGKQRVWKEGISYEHQYNCRLDPQYPVRSKRHGTFVWDQFPAIEVDRMLHHYGIVADRSQQTSGKQQCQTPVEYHSQFMPSNTNDQSQHESSQKPSCCTKHVTVSKNTPKTDSLVNTVHGTPATQQGDSGNLPPIYA